MTNTMQNLETLSLTEMQELLNGSRAVRFEAPDRDIVYGFMERMLQNQRYSRLSKRPRGIVRQFLIKVTGLSRAQITRLIQGWSENRKVAAQPHYRPSFSRRYGDADIGLLAKVDAAHEDLAGPAI